MGEQRSSLARRETTTARSARPSALAPFALAVLITACSQKAEAPAPIALDCSQPFETLTAAVTAQPGVNAAPEEPNEPYRAYSMADARASYFVTQPGAPAHPAILMQQAKDGRMENTGCAYGDKAAYQELTAYLAGLSAGRN